MKHVLSLVRELAGQLDQLEAKLAAAIAGGVMPIIQRAAGLLPQVVAKPSMSASRGKHAGKRPKPKKGLRPRKRTDKTGSREVIATPVVTPKGAPIAVTPPPAAHEASAATPSSPAEPDRRTGRRDRRAATRTRPAQAASPAEAPPKSYWARPRKRVMHAPARKPDPADVEADADESTVQTSGQPSAPPPASLVGEKYGCWLVLRESAPDKHGRPTYLCRAECCGREKVRERYSIVHASTNTEQCARCRPRTGVTGKRSGDALHAASLRRHADGKDKNAPLQRCKLPDPDFAALVANVDKPPVICGALVFRASRAKHLRDVHHVDDATEEAVAQAFAEADRVKDLDDAEQITTQRGGHLRRRRETGRSAGEASRLRLEGC